MDYIVGSKIDPIIRFSEEKDKEEILSLLNSGFLGIQRSSRKRNEKFWDWKIINNPFGKSLLTIAESDGKIIAVSNFWPWEFNIRGSVIKALQPCDSMVHPDYRGKGIFKLMRLYGLELARKSGFKFLFNFPNRNSLKAYLSIGWHYQGKILWHIKILNPLKFMHGLYYQNKTDPFNIGSNYAIDIDIINRTYLNSFCYNGYLKINRIEGFHEWRYLNHYNRSYGMVFYENGKKSTIAIFTVNQNNKTREMVIVDLIGSTENSVPLIKMVLEAGRQMNVDMIAMMNNPLFKTSALMRVGFVPIKYKNMVVLPLDLSLEAIIKDYSSWSLMACLHDSI